MNLRLSICILQILIAFVFIPGCASVQLQRISVRQANSVADVYEQQVLDNLARFSANPHSTPSFSVVNQSTNGIEDHRAFGLSDGFLIGKFLEHLSASSDRSLSRNFTLNPVTDPNRLALMQCAYQRVVGLEPDGCDKCCDLIEAWTGKKGECWGPCGLTCGWLCTSNDPRDVPKCCEKHGTFCGTYVWVDPCHHREFSKLVMCIVDFASGSKAETADPDLKEVVFYLDAHGKFAAYGQHVQEMRAKVPQNLSEQAIETQLQLQAEIASLQKRLRQIQAGQAMLNQTVAPASAESLDKLQHLIPAERLSEMKSTWKSNSAGTIAQAKQHLDMERMAAETQLEQAQQQMGSIKQMVVPAQPSISFGPPTQFNGLYGGGLLQLQQRLNTVPGTR